MRSNRRKNWFIKRIALGLAIAAFAAPVAQARIDEGSSVQANGYQAFATDFPSVPSGQFAKGIVNSDYPSLKPTVVASAYGMGYASAMAMLLLAVAFAVTFIIVRNSRRWVHYQAPAIR